MPLLPAVATLVGRQRGIALDHRDPVDADAELFGGHLRNRDAQTLAEIDLARVNRHRAIGVDGDEAVDLAGVERLAERAVAARALREGRSRNGETDDQRTAGLQEFAARQRRVHAVALPEARSIARRILSCVPQRHRLPASACCASSRLRFGLRASAAAPVITMPVTQ